MKKILGKIISENDGVYEIEPENPIDKIDEYEVFFVKKSKKRGLDANALSWTLIDRLAKEMKSSRDEIYDLMLTRYGVATYMIVKPSYLKKITDMLEHYRILGEVEINGQKGIQIQVFIGSSYYNSEEFASYLNGIISECENLGLVIEDKDVFYDSIARWDLPNVDK
jgi:hypothetical protein